MDVKEMARLGGLASAKVRLKGLTKKQISRRMSEIRLQGIKNKAVNSPQKKAKISSN